MTKSNNGNETPDTDGERRREDEEWERLWKLLRSAERHREAAEYWNAIAREERRRGIFR
jgi:hypothetical protein